MGRRSGAESANATDQGNPWRHKWGQSVDKAFKTAPDFEKIGIGKVRASSGLLAYA